VIDHIVELVSEFPERLDVTLEQVHAIAVQRFDVILEYLRGEFVVYGGVAIVRSLDEVANELADLFVPGFRLQNLFSYIRGGDCRTRLQAYYQGNREQCSPETRYTVIQSSISVSGSGLQGPHRSNVGYSAWGLQSRL
jgi:hypothetical protein